MKRYSPLVLLMFFVVGCSSSPSCDTSQPSSEWHNCIGMDVEKGNGTYIGEYKHGVRHGKGEFESINGNIFFNESVLLGYSKSLKINLLDFLSKITLI